MSWPRAFLVVAGLLVASLTFLSMLTGFLVDWLWFDTLGFGAVFAIRWHTELAVFTVVAGGTALVLALNGLIAVGGAGSRGRRLRLMRPGRDRDDAPDVIEF